jgi:hypothetical protein
MQTNVREEKRHISKQKQFPGICRLFWSLEEKCIKKTLTLVTVVAELASVVRVYQTIYLTYDKGMVFLYKFFCLYR